MQANYNCSQQTLYTAANLGWNSCTQHINSFKDFSDQYDPAFIAARIAEVEAAALLPDDQARNGITETLRIQLTQLADASLADFQRLKRYISKAFGPEFHKAQYEIAGQNYYEKAANYNWDSLKGLLTSASNYINNNLATLTQNQNMPVAFPPILENNKNSFFALHPQFLDSEETSRQDAATKIIANNAIYNSLINMFLDGQQIFRNDEAVKKQFIFDQVLLLIDGAGTAGVRGTVTDSVTTFPLEGVSVKLMPGNYTGTTNADGIYRISPMASGIYTVTYNKASYQELVISNHEVKVGTVSTLNSALIPV